MAAEYEQKTSLLDYFSSSKLSPLPHLHKELELVYVKKGRCRAIANTKVYELSDGDVFLTFPYQVHYYLDSMHGQYYVHAFPASTLTTLESTINNNELIDNVFHIDNASIEASYFSKITEASGPYAVAERFAYLILIMSRLLVQSNMKSMMQSSGMTVRSILEYCSTHYAENLSLDTLAKQLHLNKYYISHSINRQINMRLSTFINSLRIDAACKLLQNSEKRIAEIAQAVGYETIRSFNRAFVDIAGCTPKQYRQNYLHSHSKN